MNTLKNRLTPRLLNIISHIETESARQGHYYLGVEHLFMALTRIENGVTANALTEMGLSPRFIRHSVRAAAGPGDSRRHWPGFRTTPRYKVIIQYAQKLADARGKRRIGEQDLLLAILSEKENIAARVLVDLGVDLERLKASAAGLQDTQGATYPPIPISGAELPPEHVRVLSQMFNAYTRLTVVHTFEGFSGASVLLIRPTKPDGRDDADVIVKLDHARVIWYEKLRYDSYVKSTLPPVTARITDPPVVLDKPDIGGLKYTFVGQRDAAQTQTLYDYVQRHGPAALGRIIKERVHATFGQGWWRQRQPYGFALWQEYEHVLPPALVVELEGDQSQAKGHKLQPRGKWSRANSINVGDMVTLDNFTIDRVYPERQELKLIAGASASAADRANKVMVRGDAAGRAVQGDRARRLVGRVIQTRRGILHEQAQAIFPDLDLGQTHITVLPDLSLPNPLVFYAQLLQARVDGTLSTIHGDLHLGNILVDPDERSWLIDFRWTRDGHTLFDWAVLEVSILADVIAPLVKGNIQRVITALLALNEQAALPTDPGAFAQSFEALRTVREIVQRCLFDPRNRGEYFAGLAMCALRAITWGDTTTSEAKELLFWVAALATSEAQRLLTTKRAQDITEGFTGGILDTNRQRI